MEQVRKGKGNAAEKEVLPRWEEHSGILVCGGDLEEAWTGASLGLGPSRGTAALGRHRTGLSSAGSQQSSLAPAEAPGGAGAKPVRSILHPPGGGGDPRGPPSSSSPGGTGLLVQARPPPGLPHRRREPGWGAKPPPLRAQAQAPRGVPAAALPHRQPPPHPNYSPPRLPPDRRLTQPPPRACPHRAPLAPLCRNPPELPPRVPGPF